PSCSAVGAHTPSSCRGEHGPQGPAAPSRIRAGALAEDEVAVARVVAETDAALAEGAAAVGDEVAADADAGDAAALHVEPAPPVGSDHDEDAGAGVHEAQ